MPVESAHSLRLSMNISVREMVQELNDLKAFFQHGLDGEDARQRVKTKRPLGPPSPVTAPSEVVSPSAACPPPHKKPPNKAQRTLATRRGQVTPSPIVTQPRQLSQSTKPLPKASLKPKTQRNPKSPRAGSDSSAKSLRVEDMIHNLRLKCSTMTLDTGTPGTNTVPLPRPPAAEKEESGPPDVPVHTSTKPVKPLPPRSGKPTESPGPLRKPRPRPKTDTPAPISPPPAQRPPDVPTTALRSALVSVPSPPKSVKNVRFALSKVELEKVLSESPAPRSVEDVSGSRSRLPRRNLGTSQTHVSVSIGGMVRPPSATGGKPNLCENFNRPSKTIPNAHDPERPVSCSSEASEHGVQLAAAIVIAKVAVPSLTEPLPTSMQRPSLVEDRTPALPRRSAGSLSRHSLSRIMKGPIFGTKDPSKRSTFSSLRNERVVDENLLRREFVSDDEVSPQKKSRVPVPLRTILERFR